MSQVNSITIALINPNNTAAMTGKCALAARQVVSAGTTIIATNPATSPPSIQGFYDVALSVPPLLECIAEFEQDSEAAVDAYVIACFDDTGLDAARCLTTKPVIGIGEAAFHMAAMVSNCFSVVTTLSRSVPGIERNLDSYGLNKRCAKVRASDIPVLALEEGDPEMMALLYGEIEAALAIDHAESIVLGCAGMVDMVQALQVKFGVPIIDGVTAAVSMAEAMVRCGLKTSKSGGYAFPASS